MNFPISVVLTILLLIRFPIGYFLPSNPNVELKNGFFADFNTSFLSSFQPNFVNAIGYG